MKVILCLVMCLASSQATIRTREDRSVSLPDVTKLLSIINSITGANLSIADISEKGLNLLSGDLVANLLKALGLSTDILGGVTGSLSFKADAIESLIDKLLSALQKIKVSPNDDCVKDALAQLKQIKDQFASCYNSLLNVSNLQNSVVSETLDIFNTLSTNGSGGVLGALDGILDKVLKAVKGLVDTLVGTVNQLLNAAKSTICTVAAAQALITKAKGLLDQIASCLKKKGKTLKL